jgi:hypothetical protein
VQCTRVELLLVRLTAVRGSRGRLGGHHTPRLHFQAQPPPPAMARKGASQLVPWRFSGLLALLTMAVAGQAAVNLDEGGTAAAARSGGTVPCSQLPELKHLALRVAILGDCA